MATENRSIALSAKRSALTNLGRLLRNARQNAKLTQRAVAQHLVVTSQTVRNWESGRNEPDQDTLDSLALLYNLHPEQLKTEAPLLHSSDLTTCSNQRIKVDPAALTQARRDAGLSQAQASSRSGVNISSIRRYERGIANPQRQALQRLALIYGKPPSWLDPAYPNPITVLQPSQMDPVLQLYLQLQPELTSHSVRQIAQFILHTFQNQPDGDRI